MNVTLNNSNVSKHSSIIITVTSAIMNLICSIILSQFYYWIARKLTDFGEKFFSFSIEEKFFLLFCRTS